jgi:TPR repeat protein
MFWQMAPSKLLLLISALAVSLPAEAAKKRSAVRKPVAASAAADTMTVVPKSGFSLALRDAMLSQRWDLARPELEKLATSGNMDAMVALGTIYMRGMDGQKNIPEAKRLLGDAAARGSGMARRALAVHYFKGDFNGGAPEYSKAWAFIFPLAEANDPMGLFLAGKIIRDGLLGSANENAGREMIMRAAVRGWPEAQREMTGLSAVDLENHAESIDKNNQPVSALAIMKREAGMGNIDAIWQLGLVNLYGVGVPADPAQAQMWYERGQARGDVASAIMLAEMAKAEKLPPELIARIRKNPIRAGTAYALIARQLAEGRGGVDINIDRAAIHALIAGYLGAPDSFDLIAATKAKLTPENFIKAEEAFRAWRAETLPAS